MEPFIGQIQGFGFNFSPVGWEQCNGQLVSISQNSALFALLGTTYGGDGQNTFALPDLRGRSMVHPGTGPGLSTVNWGDVSGFESTTLLLANLPAHNHSVSVAVKTVTGEDVITTNKILASGANRFSEDVVSGAFLGGLNELAIGGNQPLAIRNPYLALNVCIAIEGIFPSRN